MMHTPFYDPNKSYEDNYAQGPFGEFTNEQEYQNSGEPTYDFAGQKVFLPFGIPAGPLLNSKFVNAALDKGFDLVIYKTVRTAPYPCHPWPNVLAVKVTDDLKIEQAQGEGVVADNIYTEPLAITNSFGVPSMDPEVWQPDMKKAIDHAKKGQVVIGSFQGTVRPDSGPESYIQDWVQAAKLIKETGVKVVEANLSCPNEGSSHMLCFDLERTTQITHAIKEVLGDIPLFLKLAYFSDQEQLSKLIDNVGTVVQGFSTINTIASKIYDREGNQALPGNGRLVSGVCGHPIKWAGIEMVKRVKALRDEKGMKFSILGVGGVTSPEDYEEYRKAGAEAVMSATGAMWNPLMAQEIKQTLNS
jgi:dihydroorotate dehydrogenase